MQIKAYVADRIFTGTEWLDKQALIIEGDTISSILPAATLPSSIKTNYYPGWVLVPAFIDLQIYGARDRLFSAHPSPASLKILVESNRDAGTILCLPTVATNTRDVLECCLDACRQYLDEDGKGILGLHAEGPWINPEKKGAHLEDCIRKPEMNDVSSLLDYGRGVIRMITLAPELCSREVLELIHSQGIVVASGHSMASYEEATRSFDHGVSAVTHLYNAMSPLAHRSPGLVGATLDHDRVFASVIPDGYHVDFAAIRIAKKIMQHRLYAITDAVTSTAVGDYLHELEGDKYISNNILSGSALTMFKGLHNLVYKAGIELSEALRMCSLYPAQLMKLEHQYGCIKPGNVDSMILIKEDLSEKPIWPE